MTPIFQRVSDPKLGDCMRATVASILDVPMEAIPNFSCAPDGLFHHLFEQTMFAYGWKLEGNAIHDGVIEWKDGSINGYYLCSVPSKNFECCQHSVIIDDKGVVVHDPAPNQDYLGVELFKTSRLNNIRNQPYAYFHIFSKRTDEDWLSIEKCIEWHKQKKLQCRGAFDNTVERCPEGE